MKLFNVIIVNPTIQNLTITSKGEEKEINQISNPNSEGKSRLVNKSEPAIRIDQTKEEIPSQSEYHGPNESLVENKIKNPLSSEVDERDLPNPEESRFRDKKDEMKIIQNTPKITSSNLFFQAQKRRSEENTIQQKKKRKKLTWSNFK